MAESRRNSTPGVTLLDAADLYYFNEGTHSRLYEKLGAHPLRLGETQGTYFAVWAPNAACVYAMGDFNGWQKDSHPLQPRGQLGIWEGFLAGVEVGSTYKYHIVSKTVAIASIRPTHMASAMRCRRGPLPSWLSYGIIGVIRRGWQSVRSAMPLLHPWRFTRYIWAPGGVCRRRGIVPSAIGNWPPG